MTALLGFIIVLALAVLVVSIIGLIVQLIRRRPSQRWGVMAAISFVVLIVAALLNPTNTTGPGKQSTTPESSTTPKTQATTTQKTTAPKTTTVSSQPPQTQPTTQQQPAPSEQQTIPVQQPAPQQQQAPAQSPPSSNAPGEDPGGYYASSSRTAYLIYCASNPEWRNLSKNNLQHFGTLEQAEATYPNRQLRC